MADPNLANASTASLPASSSSLSPPDWTVRDTALDLLNRGDGDDTTESSLFTSSLFDVDVVLANIRRDKSFTVRQAFDAGAQAVLSALEHDDDEEDDDDNYEECKLDLPIQLQHPETHSIGYVRKISLERSHENKEYARRKGGKTDIVKPSTNTTTAAKKSKPASKKAASTTTAKKASTTTKSTKPTKASSKSKTAPDTPSKSSKSKSTDESSPKSTSKSTTKKSSSKNNSSSPPKFTRNTPASSAAALDSRLSNSRAILCSAANLAFQEEDLLNIPKNDDMNMGAIAIDAKKLGERVVSACKNATRRAELRHKYRQANALANENSNTISYKPIISNPFSFAARQAAMISEDEHDNDDDDDDTSSVDDYQPLLYSPNADALTDQWNTQCLPRFLEIMKFGAGHAIYHDTQWITRHGRLADMLRNSPNRHGPHLIVTTKPEVPTFAQEFLEHSIWTTKSDENNDDLRALVYKGSKKERRKIRQTFFPRANGLPSDPFHVLIVSYTNLLKDYLHFCQIPFQITIVDEGAAWMAATKEYNSALGSIWDSALFSSNDHHAGLAGTSYTPWDFSQESTEIGGNELKDTWIGLTSRHKILTAYSCALTQRAHTELLPVAGLVDFVAPHFASISKEEWDRSRITADVASMRHFRQLLAKTTVVHKSKEDEDDTDDEDEEASNMDNLALQALSGQLQTPKRVHDPPVPRVISDDEFVSSGKVAFSRRTYLQWLDPKSWIRYELGDADLKPIADAMKASNNHGHFCEEITTAASTTSTGATGQVAGTMAYRLAVRCGRHFGSEQGLRQHLSTHHAPAGTWLCRVCSADCITSQARTHHERSCGQPATGQGSEPGGNVGATPTVGQGVGKQTGAGKKKTGRTNVTSKASKTDNEKDPDGSIRVPGYRGVWVNKSGKHFIKIDGERFEGGDESEKVLLFNTADDAAKKYDSVIKATKKGQKLELNFKPDGSRIKYEENTPATTSGVGGAASNVVPALSVINIKDLPPDVKPLLRDPRQTSRTGGNSKRHVYAYRGVCRQARKGHDRWQSQISFMGVNHYLGTFDSEWDAAAIYAWAHLILYGEEATRQAQKEGEEAAAAYEKEKRDIAAGKIPEPPAKPEKKKAASRKPKEKKSTPEKKNAEKKPKQKKKKEEKAQTVVEEEKKEKKSRKRKAGTDKAEQPPEKKARTSVKMAKTEKEEMAMILSNAVKKVPILSLREQYEAYSDSDLLVLTARKTKAARDAHYCASVPSMAPSAAVRECVRPCCPRKPNFPLMGVPVGAALLLGLSPSSFEWDLQDFVETRLTGTTTTTAEQDKMALLQLLAVEYDDDGMNEKFGSLIQGTMCVIGCANKMTLHLYNSLGLGYVPLGGTVGRLDCHIGGAPGSASERAACIRYVPKNQTNNNNASNFQISCLSETDIVTLNGRRITPELGCFPLQHEDVCSVGARVFAFVLPMEKVQ